MSDLVIKAPEGKKVTKKKFNVVSITDYKYLEDKYREMALEGWIINSIKGVFDSYYAIEPIELDFSVSIFQPFSGLDYPDKEKPATYKEFCEDSGWSFAAKDERYHVFYKSPDDEASPIHTDPADEYKTARSAFLRGESIFMLVILLQIGMLIMKVNFFRYDDLLLTGGLYGLLFPLLLIIICTSYFSPIVFWLISNGRRVNNGLNIKHFSHRFIKKKSIVVISMILVYCLYVTMSLLSMLLSGIPTFIMVFVLLMVLIPFGIGMLVKTKIRRIPGSRWENGALLAIAMVIALALMFGAMAIGFSRMDVAFDEELENLPSVPMISFEDFGTMRVSEPRHLSVQSSFLSPTSFEVWFDAVEDVPEGELSDIDIEYIQTRYQWVSDLIVSLMIGEEVERMNEDYMIERNNGQVVNYVYAIEGYADQVDDLYNMNSYKSEILLAKGKTIYRISLNTPVDEEAIAVIVNKLFAR